MTKVPVLLPPNRKFGYFFSAIFLAAAAYFLYEDLMSFAALFFLLFLVFSILSLFYPNSLEKLNYCWYVLGIWLGKIVSPIVLGLIFFILISPIAIILRWRGRDELKLRRSSYEESTYWIDRVESIGQDSFKDQF